MRFVKQSMGGGDCRDRILMQAGLVPEDGPVAKAMGISCTFMCIEKTGVSRHGFDPTVPDSVCGNVERLLQLHALDSTDHAPDSTYTPRIPSTDFFERNRLEGR